MSLQHTITCCQHHGECAQGDYCPVRMAAAAAIDARALGQTSQTPDPVCDHTEFWRELAHTFMCAASLFGICAFVVLAAPYFFQITKT